MKYESVTKYLAEFNRDSYGKWSEQTGDGTPENPYVFCHFIYDDDVKEFVHAVFKLDLQGHELYDVHHGMEGKDIAELTEIELIAKLKEIVSLERFSDGFIEESIKNGTIPSVLRRLVGMEGERTSPAEVRIEVFRDTMSWIKSDPALAASISIAKKNTTIFYEDDYPAFDSSNVKEMLVTISGDRSYQAAMRLHKDNPEAKIAVMNFANAFHAGGGVTKGSSAQEESLCRTSTLYPLLYRRTLRDSFYKHHYDRNTPKASDSLIYTEGVIICKTDEDIPKRMRQEDWVTVDVITIAAPDLRHKSNKHAPLVNGGTYMNNAELFGYHVKRAIHMLTCAAAKGADILVLGAFGCGAFKNDPEVVARAYKTALQEFPKVFKQIEFAVYCPPGGSLNYDVFKYVLI